MNKTKQRNCLDMLTMLTQLLHTRCLESSTIDMHNSYSFGNSAKRQKRVGVGTFVYTTHEMERERGERESTKKKETHKQIQRQKKKKGLSTENCTFASASYRMNRKVYMQSNDANTIKRNGKRVSSHSTTTQTKKEGKNS